MRITKISIAAMLAVLFGILSISVFSAEDQETFDNKAPKKDLQFTQVKFEKNAHQLPLHTEGEYSHYLPERLKRHADVQPLKDGFIDVTKPPYNAKGDGITDDTEAIQKALDDCYLCRMIVYLPSGTYLVSDQLRCFRGWNDMWNYTAPGRDTTDYDFGRLSGYQIMGSSSGKRSIIKLKDHSRVKENLLLTFKQYGMSLKLMHCCLYSALVRNVDFDMGNNPDVSAIYLPGAQFCTIEDVNIWGENFYAGIKSPPGCGGCTTNLKITGGMYGIVQTAFRPDPLVTGVTLIGQKKCAVLLKHCRGPLVLTGFKIVSEDKPADDYKAIWINRDITKYGNTSLALGDGSIEVKGENGSAIETDGPDVVMKNVYFKSSKILSDTHQTYLRGEPETWKKFGVATLNRRQNPVVVDGKDLSAQKIYTDNITNEAPSEEMYIKHSWKEMPSWDESDLVNVVRDYGATPSFGISNEYLSGGKADDEPIQKAIDETTTPGHPNFGKVVFIPHGDYRITKPIILKKGTRLIGAGKTSCVLQQAYDAWEDPSRAVVESVDEAEGNIVVSDLYICSYPRGRFFHFKSGNMMIRDVQTHVFELMGTFPEASYPYATFSGNISGKFYTHCSDHVAKYDDISTQQKSVVGDNYRMLTVENKISEDPLFIYQTSIAHLDTRCGLMRIVNSKNVHFPAIEHEAIYWGHTLMHIENSSDVSVLGSAGIYFLSFETEPAIFHIKNSSNVEFLGLTKFKHSRRCRQRLDPSWIKDNEIAIKDESDQVIYYNN